MPIILVGGGFLVWYYAIDGVYVRQVIEYDHSIDQYNMPTVKDTYAPGELVEIKVAFCKTRRAIGFAQWTLANQQLTVFAQKGGKELPLGCYPSGDQEYHIVAVEKIPENASEGEHQFSAVITHVLPGDRERKLYIATQKFNVVKVFKN